jgi:predicted secreted protein
MSALTAFKGLKEETWTYRQFTLTSGHKAFQGGRACLDTTTGKVVEASTSTTQLPIGIFAENVDASSSGFNADSPVNVYLERELTVVWFANDAGGGAVLAANVGSVCYMKDDQTVTITSTGASVAGRVWALDTSKGVAVQKLDGSGPTVQSGSLVGLASTTTTALPAFVSNDSAPATVTSGTTYTVPATSAASTVTLPAGAADGTIIFVVADGTNNANTVQFRDATGPANITTALTALKRFYVICEKVSGKWFANAYVSP